MTRVLALDVGTSSVRARIHDATGTVEANESARTHYDAVHSAGGRVDVDADHLVDATSGVIDRILSPGEHVDAVAASCFWHSLLALDALRLRRAVLALPEELRFAVTAHFWGEVPVREIARQEGLSSVAIRKRLRRAVSRLRAELEERAP